MTGEQRQASLAMARRGVICAQRKPGLSSTERSLALGLMELVTAGVITRDQAAAVVNAVAMEARLADVGMSRSDLMAALLSAWAVVAPGGEGAASTPPPLSPVRHSATEGQ